LKGSSDSGSEIFCGENEFINGVNVKLAEKNPASDTYAMKDAGAGFSADSTYPGFDSPLIDGGTGIHN
jgi:hypothetical protein